MMIIGREGGRKGRPGRPGWVVGGREPCLGRHLGGMWVCVCVSVCVCEGSEMGE